MKHIAIDPGMSGGIAVFNGENTYAFPMPETMPDMVELLTQIRADLTTKAKVIMEHVGPMPHDGKASMFKFARHVGNIQAALYALGFSTEEVSPQKWQKRLSLPKDKTERKRAIKEMMQRKHPGLSVTLKTADALAILDYAMEAK
jgi:hypothetical protein